MLNFDILLKEWVNLMERTQELPSLKEYYSAKMGKQDLRSLSAQTVDATSDSMKSISPFKNSKNVSVSYSARKKALDFAHPIDKALIEKLDNHVVNTLFNKFVQASIDANYGLRLASGIRVSKKNYPEIYEIVEECADTLGICVPYVIISNSVSGMNASTAGTDHFAFIAMSSMLPMLLNKDELRFVIGHECGHLVMGHVVYHTAMNLMGIAGGLLPIVGPIIAKTISYPLNAWSRRSEISADRAGLICCGDLGVAKRTLIKLEAGFMNVNGLDIDAYVKDSTRLHSSLGLGEIKELLYSHPIIPKRVKALDLFYRSQIYAKINPSADNQGKHLLYDEELKNATEKILEVL